MLQAFGLSITVDPRLGPLFEDVSLSLAPGEKVVLVGPNGAGKSLLLQMLAGLRTPDRGRVVRPPSVGYLRQDFDLGFEGTLRELLERDSPDVPAHRVAPVLHRLGLSPSRLDQRYATLSLGERMRGQIAALLVQEPEVLLLDEPTNHLDADVRKWLTEFLQTCDQAALIATHDRALADEVAERVLELERGELRSYTGNLSAMRAEKAGNSDRARAEFEKHRREDHRLRVAMEVQYQKAANMTNKHHIRDFDPKGKPFFGAKQARMDKRAAALRSRIEQGRQTSHEKPFEAKSLHWEFPTRPLRSTEVLRVRSLAIGFGGQALVSGISFSLSPQTRLAVLGPNGSGKSTLFRVLLGEIEPLSGERAWSSDAKVAALSQARDMLPLNRPLLEGVNGDRDFLRAGLAGLGMRGDITERSTGVLSVGERTKAEIVAMMADGANVLVLDEPTNHLDLASLEALESAIAEFPGAVIFTSHDAEFVRRLATDVLDLGQLRGQ